MAKLAKTVFVKDPDHPGVVLQLDAGQEVPKNLEAAVTNEDAWEDGKPPAAAKKAAAEDPESTPEPSPDSDKDEDTKPATAKKAAATRPARGRKSAGEGDS